MKNIKNAYTVTIICESSKTVKFNSLDYNEDVVIKSLKKMGEVIKNIEIYKIR